MSQPDFSSQNTGSLSDSLKGSVPDKYLQYLKGHEQAATNALRIFWVALVGFGLYWFKDPILSTLDGIVNMFIKLSVIVGFFGASYLIYKVVGNKTFQDAMNHAIDKRILAFARWVKAHGDQFLEAEFDITLIEKYKVRLNEAYSRIVAVLKGIRQSAVEAENVAKEAGMYAKGLGIEIERRKAGNKTAAVSMKIAQMSDSQLLENFERAKGRLRKNYQFYQNEATRAERLQKKAGMLQEVGRITAVRIEDMREGLRLAKQEYENALQEMIAMQAADDVENSQAARDFADAITRIKQETNLFGGRVQMLMDRLDPSVQNYRVQEAGGSIADEDFYRSWIQDTNAKVDPSVEQQILSPTEKPVIDDIEQLLGTTRTASSAARTSTSRVRTSSFNDDLLQ